jgi:uncharacterized protein (DUF2141 family)
MKLNLKLFALLFFLFAFQAFINIAKADDLMHTLSGKVTGCSTKHAVHVLIYEESGFKGMNHSQENIYKPSKSGDCKVAWSMEVSTGSYALASFEDKNDNGKLDFFFFIPKEPASFYQFNGMGAPKFEKMKIDVGANIDNIKIVLP